MPDHVHLICLPLSDANGSISIPGGAKAYKLKQVKKVLTKAGKVKLTFKIDKKTLKRIKKALARHKKVMVVSGRWARES